MCASPLHNWRYFDYTINKYCRISLYWTCGWVIYLVPHMSRSRLGNILLISLLFYVSFCKKVFNLNNRNLSLQSNKNKCDETRDRYNILILFFCTSRILKLQPARQEYHPIQPLLISYELKVQHVFRKPSYPCHVWFLITRQIK